MIIILWIQVNTPIVHVVVHPSYNFLNETSNEIVISNYEASANT